MGLVCKSHFWVMLVQMKVFSGHVLVNFRSLFSDLRKRTGLFKLIIVNDSFALKGVYTRVQVS